MYVEKFSINVVYVDGCCMDSFPDEQDTANTYINLPFLNLGDAGGTFAFFIVHIFFKKVNFIGLRFFCVKANPRWRYYRAPCKQTVQLPSKALPAILAEAGHSRK